MFFGGAAVPLLYHFGGVKSFVNSRLLDRVEVYPGNFSVRYGRRVGGVIGARSRELRYDAIHGLLDLSLLDSAALVEVPFDGPHGGCGSGTAQQYRLRLREHRRSSDFSVVAAPLYWDYQGIVETKLSPADALRVMAYGSRDGVAFFFDEPDAVDPTLRGDLEFGIEFHRLQANVSHRLSDVIRHEAMVSLGTQRASFAGGASSRAHFRSFDVDARSELAVLAAKALDVRAGIDLQAQYFEGAYVGNRPPQVKGAPLAERSGSQRVVSAEAGLWFASPAAYVELAYRPVDSVSLVPGLRADYFGQVVRHARSRGCRSGTRMASSGRKRDRGVARRRSRWSTVARVDAFDVRRRRHVRGPTGLRKSSFRRLPDCAIRASDSAVFVHGAPPICGARNESPCRGHSAKGRPGTDVLDPCTEDSPNALAVSAASGSSRRRSDDGSSLGRSASFEAVGGITGGRCAAHPRAHHDEPSSAAVQPEPSYGVAHGTQSPFDGRTDARSVSFRRRTRFRSLSRGPSRALRAKKSCCGVARVGSLSARSAVRTFRIGRRGTIAPSASCGSADTRKPKRRSRRLRMAISAAIGKEKRAPCSTSCEATRGLLRRSGRDAAIRSRTARRARRMHPLEVAAGRTKRPGFAWSQP